MAAVEHLIGLGHKRIAFIQGTAGTPSSVKRMAGFLDALNSAGIPVNDNLIIPGDYTRVGGRKAMAELLNRSNPPTAVVCANDLSALGALEEAQMRGHKQPALPKPEAHAENETVAVLEAIRDELRALRVALENRRV